MSLITDKLTSLGVPASVVDGLSAKFGDGLLGEIQTSGLQAVAEKAGIDLSNINLPEINLESLKGMLDSDGDGKLEMSDLSGAVDNLAEKAGIGDALDKAKNIVAEARGVDADGDGATGIMEAVSQAKETVTDIKDTVMNSPVGEKLASITDSASGQAGGFLGKIKSFFGV